MKNVFQRVIGVGFLLAILACDPPSTAPTSGLPIVQVKIGSQTYSVEVAADPYSRETGLMNRDLLPKDRGMIFVFPDEAKREFWMKNTRIPLDIVYLDGAGKVVSVKSMKPFDESLVPSEGPAKFAVELADGQGKETGVKPGDTVVIPPEATSNVK